MKTAVRHSAYTLIELLVVIAIIGLLAALILPGMAIIKTKALRAQAQQQMAEIATAISAYEAKYGRLPMIPGVPGKSDDVTFGWDETGPSPTVVITTNAALIAILMDEVTYGNGQPTPNQDHVLNTQRIRFLNAERTSELGARGLGPDGEYRDPWGQPYVISLDYGDNSRCRDAVYSRAAVSQTTGQKGLNGLFNRLANGNSDDFEFNGRFMIWSKGQDRRAADGQKADAGENHNNLLNWRP